jgi:hypothetical protein
MTPVAQNAWVLASRIAPQVGGVVLLILGARFLDPATLGSFVLIFAWIELLRRLSRAGWREAVILDTDSCPATWTAPLEAFSRPVMIMSNVDFPEPLGPTMPIVSP